MKAKLQKWKLPLDAGQGSRPIIATKHSQKDDQDFSLLSWISCMSESAFVNENSTDRIRTIEVMTGKRSTQKDVKNLKNQFVSQILTFLWPVFMSSQAYLGSGAHLQWCKAIWCTFMEVQHNVKSSSYMSVHHDKSLWCAYIWNAKAYPRIPRAQKMFISEHVLN